MTVAAERKADSRTRLSARYVDDDLVISDTHVWTYLRLPTTPYEFLDGPTREGLAERINIALSGLVTSGNEAVEAHLIVTSRPMNVDYWAHGLDQRVRNWAPAPGYATYRTDMADYLKEVGFVRKEVYLGVCLGARNGKGSPQAQTVDLLGPIRKWLGKAEAALEFEDDVIPDAHLEFWRRKAKDIQRSLMNSHIQAQPAHPNAVAWLVQKPLWPAMTVPAPTVSPNRVWGPGEIQALAEGRVTNGHKFLTIEQVDEIGRDTVGYTATLCLSRFPDRMYFPEQEPWMHFASSLAFPVDLYSRFTIVPATKVQKDVKRKLQEAKDQAQHIAETGSSVPLEVLEQLDTATALEYTISKDRQPWIYGRHRIVVSAPTEDMLRARVQRVIEHYRDLGIDVVWPSGDQLNLLCEAMPGDKVRARAYYQRQELSVISGGMPTASSDVGDRIHDGKGWVGWYIGETTSRVRCGVHFSPHVAINRNNAPGVAITGAPGGGKSFFAFTMAYQMAMQGVWTIYIDPKADAKPMAELPGLGKPRVFDLRHGNDGMLDPFSLADSPSEATLLALETVRLLLGKNMDSHREEALMRAIEQVSQEPQPSLGRVVDVLSADTENVEARNLGTVLRQMRGMDFARLCFAAQGGDRIRPEDGLTVITLLGLELPTEEQVRTGDLGYDNRLAVAIMYLLTRYARRLMLSMNKDQPKAICIDEAWAITSTPQGRQLIPLVARMGRSHNTALVLVSQNAGDLMEEGVTNSISSKFAFRANVREEVDNVLRFFGMDVNDPHRAAVRDLENGECLMQDIDQRIARVQIDGWNQMMKRAFDTNPETRGKSHGLTTEAHRPPIDPDHEWGVR